MKVYSNAKPVIAGGRPVRKKLLDFHRPQTGHDELKAVGAVLKSGWLTKGPKTKEFEKKIAAFVKGKYAIGLNSCSSALDLALKVLSIGEGSEVITTPLSFAATANAIVHCGARPVFVDVDPLTLNIDPAKIEKAITRKTKCILPVHLYGQPCEMNSILRLARGRNIFVVADAAHALETVYQNKKMGGLSDITCFSFHPGKNITCAEGGMLVTNKKTIAHRALIMSFHGIEKDAWKRHHKGKIGDFTLIEAGYKYNMSDVQAAIGLCQLKKIKSFLRKRRDYSRLYNKAFSKLPQVRVITKNSAAGNENGYHMFVIEVIIESLKIDRDVFLKALIAENITAGMHYPCLHLQPYYKNNFGYRRGMLPHAEYASGRLISLPLYPKMTRSDVESVISAVFKIANFYKR
ncbi:MAG: DegT/DnrJ/EryC1/StrS family aminotransferase [Candidatus Omnitrophica bacterium]|nr:DegT/DnrJ/EryC1/StrS family aminotransferase [Candidatus Omnitrophota bacterium]